MDLYYIFARLANMGILGIIIPLTSPGRPGVETTLAALAEWYFNCYDLRFCNHW